MADDRVECFLLGARAHDHVDDLLWTIQEIAEAKADTTLRSDAVNMQGSLLAALHLDVSDAVGNECLPGEVKSLYERFQNAHTAEDQQEALYALSVKLGDPPGLRNLRRAKNIITSKPGGPPEEKK